MNGTTSFVRHQSISVEFFVRVLVVFSTAVVSLGLDHGLVLAAPEVTDLDNLSYTEQQGWARLDTSVTVSSATNDYSEGYVEIDIPSATSADNLRLVGGGDLSVVGDAV